MTNFKIISSEKISIQFLKLDLHNFISAAEFIKNIPYVRNINKENDLCVLAENGGTCSTKHALLKRLAQENNYPEIKLMLGVFNMNAENTPKISKVIEKYHLKEMPEAHSYLKYQNKIIDCTRKNSRPEDFMNDLVEELEIQPGQILDFKIQYHQNFITDYLQKNPAIAFTTEEFWQIREECITALAH